MTGVSRLHSNICVVAKQVVTGYLEFQGRQLTHSPCFIRSQTNSVLEHDTVGVQAKPNSYVCIHNYTLR